MGLFFLPLPGLLYGIGYAAGIAAFVWLARRRGAASENVWNVCAAGVLGGLVGAHVAQWMFAGRDLDALGGKSVLGAVAGGWLAVALVKRRLRITRPTGDMFLLGLCAGEAVGRWGCFFGGCCYGRPFGGPWAVWQHDAWRHPTQIYSSLAGALIFFVLLRVERTRPPVNTLFYLGGLLYAAARFGIEFFRADDMTPSGLSTAQDACLLAVLFFGLRLWRLVQTRNVESYAPVS